VVAVTAGSAPHNTTVERKVINMTNTISTQLDAEIAKARKQAADRIAKLKREAAAEQKKIDAKVIELLREQEPELHERLTSAAANDLATAKAKSSKGVRRAAPTNSSEPTNIDDARHGFGAGA
jgi:dsDNA-specific endonuclease/ATPase MutS2